MRASHSPQTQSVVGCLIVLDIARITCDIERIEVRCWFELLVRTCGGERLACRDSKFHRRLKRLLWADYGGRATMAASLLIFMDLAVSPSLLLANTFAAM